jgi:hypothetical protein
VTHILILTPSLSRVSVAWSDTYAQIVLECHRRGVKLSRVDATDPGLLPHARNVLLAVAVDSDATHALWWDADVSFAPADLFDLVERPEAMICRPYPMRGTDFESLHNFLADQPTALPLRIPTVDELRNASMLWSVGIHYENGKPVWSEDGTLLRVGHTGFGFVLHKVDKLRSFVTETGLWDVRSECDWHRRMSFPAFNHQPNEQSVLQGEDVSFCWRWNYWARPRDRMMWAAPDAYVRNGGRVGRFADYLEMHGIERPVHPR